MKYFVSGFCQSFMRLLKKLRSLIVAKSFLYSFCDFLTFFYSETFGSKARF